MINWSTRNTPEAQAQQAARVTQAKAEAQVKLDAIAQMEADRQAKLQADRQEHQAMLQRVQEQRERVARGERTPLTAIPSYASVYGQSKQAAQEAEAARRRAEIEAIRWPKIGLKERVRREKWEAVNQGQNWDDVFGKD